MIGLLTLLAAASLAAAPGPQTRSTGTGIASSGTSASAASASGPAIFGLIIANNRGMELGRAPLQYADDDGAKYYDILSMITPQENLVLLTRFDPDTRRLFSRLDGLTRAPTRENVAAAVDSLAKRIAAVRASGRTADLFFIFAGHGDVDQGRGFLELEDGAFRSDDLRRALERLGATHTHVVLDSCNSFFVLNPRSPGGRRFATPQDAARSLQQRLPRVGVFLSTSAEAETFEWSELQSGIFSYAVRAGLLGAADANADGKITYEELAAFVQTSTQNIRNPIYRPHLFERGPDGNRDAVLIDWNGAHAPAVEVGGDEPVRVTLRDRDGLPWADAYKEAGAKLVLRIPPDEAPHAVVEKSRFDDGHREVIATYAFPDAPVAQPLSLAQLALEEPRGRSRGADEIFEALFTQPFGPSALAHFEKAQAAAPPVIYGVSMADVERMHLLLGRLADVDRNGRAIQIGWMTTAAASLGVIGALNVIEKSGDKSLGVAALGVGAAVGLGTLLLPRPGAGEQLAAIPRGRWCARTGGSRRSTRRSCTSGTCSASSGGSCWGRARASPWGTSCSSPDRTG